MVVQTHISIMPFGGTDIVLGFGTTLVIGDWSARNSNSEFFYVMLSRYLTWIGKAVSFTAIFTKSYIRILRIGC